MRAEVGDKIRAGIARRWNKERQKEVQDLEFLRHSHEATGGYAPKITPWSLAEMRRILGLDVKQMETQLRNVQSYIQPHPAEDPDEYYIRVLSARPLNLVSQAVTVLTGFLTKKPPTRSGYPEVLEKWLDSVTLSGVSWDLFMGTEVLPQLLRYGYLPVFAHHLPSEAVTVFQREQEGTAHPIVQTINPECIMECVWAADGGFEWLKWYETIERTENPLAEEQEIWTRYWWATRDGWWLVDVPQDAGDDDEFEIQQGQAGDWGELKGEVPIAVWRLPGRRSLIRGASLLQLDLYNVDSQRRELEDATAYPMLSAPEYSNEPKARKTGPRNLFGFPHDATHRPEWMAPPDEPLMHFREIRETLKRDVNAEFALEFSQGAETGVAQAYKMTRLTRILATLAQVAAKGEWDTHRLVAPLLRAQLAPSARSNWNTRFDGLDVDAELNAYGFILDNGNSPTGKQEAEIRAHDLAMPMMDEKKRGEIEDELGAFYAGFGADERPGDLPPEQEPTAQAADEGPQGTPMQQPEAESR